MMTIENALETAYRTYTAANLFVIGFPVFDSVQYAFCDTDTLFQFAGKSKTSDDIPVFRLRIKPLSKKTESLFFSLNPCTLCTVSELDTIASGQYDGNRGKAFEALIIKAIGAKASPANSPFWICGDCEKIQIKYQYATIIHENHIAELAKISK